MNDYAYEKRALVQVEPKKAFKAKTMYRFIAVLVLIVVAISSFPFLTILALVSSHELSIAKIYTSFIITSFP